MSEYKFVQWGKGIPVDYQRLGQMASNAQYLKDRIDPSPKGIILWKQLSGLSATATGAWQNVTSLVTLPFDVSDDRLISVELNTGIINTGNIACNVSFSFTIDGNFYSEIGGTNVSASNLRETAVARYIVPTPLTKGSHTITVQMLADTGAILTIGALNSRVTLTIRDEGQFIDPAS